MWILVVFVEAIFMNNNWHIVMRITTENGQTKFCFFKIDERERSNLGSAGAPLKAGFLSSRLVRQAKNSMVQ